MLRKHAGQGCPSRNANKQLISQFDYTYDVEGEITTWAKNYAGLPAPQRFDLGYDNAGQLTTADEMAIHFANVGGSGYFAVVGLAKTYRSEAELVGDRVILLCGLIKRRLLLSNNVTPHP